MPRTWRRDLESWLEVFVSTHVGTRLGRMFGVPAAFAGRLLFSRLVRDGIAVKLPPEALDSALARGARQWTAKDRSTGWVTFRPRVPLETEAVTPFLEIAAKHAAESAVGLHGRTGSINPVVPAFRPARGRREMR
jgi:hypothetical protein